MRKFEDVMKPDTPRLVVLFKQEGEKEMFQWGVVGQMPLLTLVGRLHAIQSELHFGTVKDCPESALVVIWDAEAKVFASFVHPSVPTDSLVGMLEAIKHSLVATHMTRSAGAKQIILGTNGRLVGR